MYRIHLFISVIKNLSASDIPLSYGLLDVKIDPRYLNCIEVVWNASKDTSLFIKVHCISTEFTQHKHGGEKGVPFRIQIETYAFTNSGQFDDAQLVHCSSCQVKVFKVTGNVDDSSAQCLF